ncbi:MAG TPA: murein biosynthesis integral membrane protein MurJ [Anaerolineales bacterium]|nr:murein biosynthesis integral membrane protein MurJ [Anaerolineales bacterium]
MKRLSSVTRATILLAVFFLVDKVFAFVRSVIIARQFDLSTDLDAFNIANNLPDLLFAMISGGAIAMAFIPVLSETLTRDGKPEAWKLFSRVANFAFLATSLFALVIALFSEEITRSQIGIAPGFDETQQALVARLMRLNLIGTVLFSISGLVMAGLQANKHFFLPALAPSMYNIGMIIGALIFAPDQGYVIGGFRLPAFGFGVEGLVYGVILGAAMHLLIQVPGLARHQFTWTASIDIRDESLLRALRLISPRLLTMLGIQSIFIMRDNFASRMEQVGVVSSLTYGWMIMQVPETIIGTAIATALLPSLAEYAAQKDWQRFSASLSRALQIMTALSLPLIAVLGLFIEPLVKIVFDFDAAGTNQLTWTTRIYMFTLIGYTTQETLVRGFYARLKAWEPVKGILLRIVIYIGLVWLGFSIRPDLGAPVIAAGELAVIAEALFLYWRLQKSGEVQLRMDSAIWRGLLAFAASFLTGIAVQAKLGADNLVGALIGMSVAGFVALVLVWKPLRQLLEL